MRLGARFGLKALPAALDHLERGEIIVRNHRIVNPADQERGNHVNVRDPVALDLAKSLEDRQAIEVLGAPTEMGYPSFLGPGVPQERVAMIRAAFVKALHDPEFAATAETQGLEVNPIASTEIEKVVQRLYALPRSAVSRAAEVVP